MRTWEQAQARKIGKVRQRLAELLEEALPNVTVQPSDLIIQHPKFSSLQGGCCLWTGYGVKTFEDGSQVTIGFNSWFRMSDLIKTGIEVTINDGSPWVFEVNAKGK